MKRLILPLAAAGLLASCASIENSDAINTERELSAAGFQMKLADTPERLAHVKSLPQRKLFPTEKDGSTVFIYADATQCQCIYAGSEQDYQEYQRISLRQRDVNEASMAASNLSMAEEDAPLDWGLWGDWRRPFYY